MNFIYNKWRGNRMLINFLNINVDSATKTPGYIPIYLGPFVDIDMYRAIIKKEANLRSGLYHIVLQNIIETTLDMGI